MKEDYYKILGIDKNASDSEIKKAYDIWKEDCEGYEWKFVNLTCGATPDTTLIKDY